MTKAKKKMSTGSIVTLSIIGVFFVTGIMMLSGNSSANSVDSEKLAQCIINSDITFYGTEWCSHCKNQKVALGSIYDKYKSEFYVDCDLNAAECTAAGIRGYPSWVINGQLYEGGQSLDFISNSIGCN